jgi:hypothetical protein
MPTTLKYVEKNSNLSNAADLMHFPRHRWYVFKEAFSPELVANALADSKCNSRSSVVDPFSGSGTVALTCGMAGVRSTCYEVNPFLAFVSRTKSVNETREQFLRGVKKVSPGIKGGRKSPLEAFSSFSEKGTQKHKWLFNIPVLRAFEGGWQETIGMPSATRDLVRLALIGAAMDSCNAVQDGKCLRYRKDWETNSFESQYFKEMFESRVMSMAADLDSCPLPNEATKILLGDVRQGITSIPQFDLCVTSPPYLNSFDYSDVYRPELFLGKFVKNNLGLRKIRLSSVRSHIQAKWKDPELNDFGVLFESAYLKLERRKDDLWDPRILKMTRAYFEDMVRLLSGLRARAKKNGSLWLVVSTSAYVGIEIPVDLILAEIGVSLGWQLEEVLVLRNIRSSGQHRNYLRKPHHSVKALSKVSSLRESIVKFSV